MAESVSILGAGGWGTALGLVLHAKGHAVHLWTRSEQTVQELKTRGENVKCLPGVPLPKEFRISSDFKSLLEGKVVVLAVPSAYLRQTLEQARPFFRPGQILVSAAKGIEQKTLLRMSQVVEQILFAKGSGFRCKVAALSGPSHAEEVSRRLPTTVVVASPDKQANATIQDLFNTPWFRVYTSTDLVGVELGGSLKNVIALAAGIADGLGLGDNSKAALVSRGLAEMTRLGVALGAQASTFAGLAGLGDLVVTCNSRHSRNRHVGEELGKGRKLQEIQSHMQQVAEGVHTAVSVMGLAQKAGVEMPICQEVYRVLFEEKDPRQALEDLMKRSPKAEEAL